ncbi:hypothetical protein QQZ08_007707 [Neonectria magnoliae]|uniref:Cytochrome P450 n=1 Tax=Neonectria magnoliae TaxID=2732573 RepID=A0ABR1HY59_9HYPO
MRIHNTKPAAIYPHRDPVLSIDWIVDMSRAVRAHTILQVWDALFRTVGATFWAQNVGAWITMTNEPDNIKALLSGQFETWQIRGVQQKVLASATGPRGIFSVNGSEWHEARAMIRPSFVRNQIADLKCTDRHVEMFVERVPRDGTGLDLQELFYLITMTLHTALVVLDAGEEAGCAGEDEGRNCRAGGPAADVGGAQGAEISQHGAERRCEGIFAYTER